jgi:hypothetical protein
MSVSDYFSNIYWIYAFKALNVYIYRLYFESLQSDDLLDSGLKICVLKGISLHKASGTEVWMVALLFYVNFLRASPSMTIGNLSPMLISLIPHIYSFTLRLEDLNMISFTNKKYVQLVTSY